MKKLLLSIAIVGTLLVGALLLPTATASAHSTMASTLQKSAASCAYSLTFVSENAASIVVHINTCLAQSLGTIGIAPLTTLLVNAGVEPGIAGLMASAMIANQGLILGVDLTCSGGGVTVEYNLLVGIKISAACA